MKTAGIIAEYNPFHRGHAWQIACAKKQLGADAVIVAMSGDYVQRGTPALFSKHLRAEMALCSGADLVLELPAAVATASAEAFANGGVRLLDSLGIVDMLCFGSESGEISPLLEIARTLVLEPDAYKASLKEHLKKGLSFPAARSRALAALFPLQNETGHILKSPNNILGIEYCKALLTQNSSIKPVTLLRMGKGYHDTSLSEECFASASAIRKLLEEARTKEALAPLRPLVPDSVFPLMKEAFCSRRMAITEDFDTLLHYRLLEETLTPAPNTADMSPELWNRVQNHMSEYNGFDSFCSLLKSKELTYTRIRRALLHLLLNIADTSPKIPYARVLGFRKDSAALLTEIKKKSSIPLITRLGDSQALLSPDGTRLLAETVFASNIYEGILARKSGRSFVHEYQKQMVIL